MNRLQRAFYEQGFELAFLKRGGNAFQDFFSEIMEKRYPGDFQRVRPWGKEGDRKNDGYHKSVRKLFQLYAPKSENQNRLLNKIETDFTEAFPYWKEYFDTWVFVHNDRDGIAPAVLKKLLELESHNKPVSCGRWGFEELRVEFFGLDEPNIASIIGWAPSDKNIQNVRYEDLKIVLESISSRPAKVMPDLRPVPPAKILANGLSDSVVTLLEAGMKKADLVGEFFHRWHDPTYGDSVAEAFRERYGELRSAGSVPDEIFRGLWEYAGGAEKGAPDHEAAVLAVLAHLFEQCDIFERPRDDGVRMPRLMAGNDPASGLLDPLPQQSMPQAEVSR